MCVLFVMYYFLETTGFLARGWNDYSRSVQFYVGFGKKLHRYLFSSWRGTDESEEERKASHILILTRSACAALLVAHDRTLAIVV